jgi:hypothetical protein
MPIQLVMISLFVLILKIGIAIRTTQGIGHHQFNAYLFIVIRFCARDYYFYCLYRLFHHDLKDLLPQRADGKGIAMLFQRLGQ